MQLPILHSTGRNDAATADEEHVLDRHAEHELLLYSFYADDSIVLWPYCRHGNADFGHSEFGNICRTLRLMFDART